MSQVAFRQVTPHVYRLAPDATTDRPALGVIVGRQRTLVVDAGASPAHVQLLLQNIAQAGLPAPTFLAITHWHWDHVFGISTLNLLSFAHTETRRMLTQMAQLDWSDEALDRRVAEGTEIAFCRDMIKAELPDRSHLVLRPPEITFSEEMELDLGDVACQLVHAGGDHTVDSTVVYVPEDRILFLGDCLGPDLYHGPPHYTMEQALPLLDRLLRFDADYYLESHDLEPLSRDRLVQDANLFRTIGRTVESMGGDRVATIAALEEQLGGPLDDDAMELVDAFMAGLSKRVAS
jgi:glyoxylase-like metal-dependent hydrolase (beta-lactamase superfamily II)